MICCAVGFSWGAGSPASPCAGSTSSARLTSLRSLEKGGGGHGSACHGGILPSVPFQALLTTLLVSSAKFLGSCGHWGGHINRVLRDCQELALPLIALIHKPQHQLLQLQQLYLEKRNST